MTVTEKDIEKLEGEVDSLAKVIRGNGDGVGLRTQVALNSRYIAETRLTTRLMLGAVLIDIVGRISGLI